MHNEKGVVGCFGKTSTDAAFWRFLHSPRCREGHLGNPSEAFVVCLACYRCSKGPSVVPVSVGQKYRHYIVGNRHFSAYCRWLFPSVPSDFTGTVAGKRHYHYATSTLNTFTSGNPFLGTNYLKLV